jgi:hypothetical protein
MFSYVFNPNNNKLGLGLSFILFYFPTFDINIISLNTKVFKKLWSSSRTIFKSLDMFLNWKDTKTC